MRIARVHSLKGFEILVRPIYDSEGKKVWGEGTILDKAIVVHLIDKGIKEVYIEDEISRGISFNDCVDVDKRQHARQIVKEELGRFQEEQSIELHRLSDLVADLYKNIEQASLSLISCRDLRTYKEYLPAHLVNVCILSMILAKYLGFSRAIVTSVGMGAILHDFGEVLLPKELLYKDEKLLNKEETQDIEKHPLYIYNLLRDIQDITPITKITVLMHHERMDGTGFPVGIEKEKIHYSSRICAICDTYDKLINGCFSKEPVSADKAVRQLKTEAYRALDMFYTDKFLELVPIYEPGSFVELSDGKIGIVVKNHPKLLQRPLVRYIYNPRNKVKYNNDYIANLAEELSLNIVREMRVKDGILFRGIPDSLYDD